VSMFSTHPPTADRIARLQKIAHQLGQPGDAYGR
jgi:Zn-dependent protease with chaperone function